MNSIQGNIGTAVDTALADGLADINAAVAQLEAQVDNIASGEDVDNINETLGGLEEDLSDLLASNNVFTGDLSITSNPTLEFAEALGDKVSIINGNVIITAQSDMDAARLQAVVDKILTITGDLTVRAATSSAPAPTFDNLAGVNNIKIAQSGSISFASLVSARDIIIGDNYASRLDGTINFGALTLVSSFQTADIGDDANYTESSIDMNSILVPDATAINLMSLPYYTPRILMLEADDTATVNIDALKTQDANERARSYTISIKGASSLSGPGLVDGEITLEDVATVDLPAFTGEVIVEDGVENITLGALGDDFPAAGSTGNDLVTVDITANAADASIDLTGHASLFSATIAGEIDSVTFSGNTDLETLMISAALENLTINNTSLETASLDYTNSNLAEDASLTVTDNEDLTSFSANSVDGLANLTITNNSELETISFTSLENAPTGGDGATVTIGGSAANANAFNANEIEVIADDDGSIITDSGIEGLKTYLTAVAAVGPSVLNVYFDTADEYVSGGTTTTNLSITNAAQVANLVVVNKAAAADPAAASKRSFVFAQLAGPGAIHTLHFNGGEVTITEGNTPADFVADITSAANLAVATTNGVTLTASANALPNATVAVSQAGSALVSATTASSTGSADTVTLEIGDYSAKLYLVTTLDATFTPDPLAADDKSAENQFLIDPTATTVDNVLDALLSEFTTTTFSPYNFALGTVASGTLVITANDVSDAHHGAAITFTSSNDDAIGTTSVNLAGTTADDTLIGESVQITLVSNVDGELLSEIGNPPDSVTPVVFTAAAAGMAGFSVNSGATIVELSAHSTATSLAGTTYTESLLDSPSATNVGLEAGTAATATDRIAWL